MTGRLRFWIAVRMPWPDWLHRLTPEAINDHIASWGYPDPEAFRRERAAERAGGADA